MNNIRMNVIEVDGIVYGVGQVRQIIEAAMRLENEVERLNTEPMKAFESQMTDDNARLRRERNEALAEVERLRAESIRHAECCEKACMYDRIMEGD